jgi:hypothetical protein
MGLLDSTTQQDYYQGNDHGNYQFTSLDDVINQFIVAYVGEDKIISKVKRVDVAFHAQRALQELSFDTFKSTKAQEITLPPSLQMTLPQDYVNYTKISWVDSAGIKHLLYPTSKTSNPSSFPFQNSDGDFSLTAVGTMTTGLSTIALDSEYTNISIGMMVSGASIPSPAFALDVYNTSGITSIQLGDSPDILTAGAVNATYTGDETLTFTNNSLIAKQESAFILESVTFATSDNKITASSAPDAAQIVVGMLVSNICFTAGTTVLDVQGSVITTSTNSLFDSTAGSEVVFYLPTESSTTWSNYKSGTPSENQDDYQDDTYWPMDGSRYGLDPQHAQANGSFYIDDNAGKIHFSSNIAGKTVILDYISDSLGTDGEMQVHKFAEEAMYKCIAHAILSTRANVQEYVINRFKKERFAAVRTAKLRLSNLKLEELTQILRGKSKQIKH